VVVQIDGDFDSAVVAILGLASGAVHVGGLLFGGEAFRLTCLHFGCLFKFLLQLQLLRVVHAVLVALWSEQVSFLCCFHLSCVLCGVVSG